MQALLMHAEDACSGYDFGYLLKIVSCATLPPTETEFFELLRIWFPCIWDIKVRLSCFLPRVSFD